MREFVAKEDQITVPIAERLIRCHDCRNWQTGIAYSATGKCKLSGRITNRNFYCGDGREKDG